MTSSDSCFSKGDFWVDNEIRLEQGTEGLAETERLAEAVLKLGEGMMPR